MCGHYLVTLDLHMCLTCCGSVADAAYSHFRFCPKMYFFIEFTEEPGCVQMGFCFYCLHWYLPTPPPQNEIKGIGRWQFPLWNPAGLCLTLSLLSFPQFSPLERKLVANGAELTLLKWSNLACFVAEANVGRMHPLFYISGSSCSCIAELRGACVVCAYFWSTRNPLTILKKEPFRQGHGEGTEGIRNELTVMASGNSISEWKMRSPELK